MNRFQLLLSTAVLLFATGGRLSAQTSTVGSRQMNLAGQWHVNYDGGKTAEIQLPGTLTDAGLGNPCTLKPSMEKEVFLHLKAKYSYVGKATYSKTVFVPKEWKGQRVVLSFERTLWTSCVAVNGKQLAAEGESLSAPHEYDITDLVEPGADNRLEITVDNSRKYDISTKDLAHCYTNETQTLWNGMLGRITLTAKPQTYLTRLSLYPRADNGTVHVEIGMKSYAKAKGKLHFVIVSPQGETVKDTLLAVKGTETAFDTKVANAQTWDEFSPQVYTAKVSYDEKKAGDSKQALFGFRQLTNANAQLQVNNRRIFLRGTLESCVFPLKGYPAMDEAGWKEIFMQARQHGLNHLRFHSWCPPEAAFAVADKMGFYLQIELPVWTLNIGKDKAALDFLYAEADRILDTYGNHPSFCFLSLGNELQSDFTALEALLMHVKKDPRRLYTTTSFTFEKGHGDWPEPKDDFWVSQWSKKGWLRGQGVFEERPVSFMQDYSSAVDSLPVPVITHEIGQYSVYPDLASIPRFTGNLQPLNLVSIQQDLQRKGRLDKAPLYLSATTRFAAILYKEEVERAMKTPGYSGYQLLGLTDYPGQGTALVGLLDVFWQGKDKQACADFAEACIPVVPLAFYDKATWLNNETFKASFRIANFSAATLQQTTLQWTLKGENGRTIAQGDLQPHNVKVGNQQNLGQISVPLTDISKAERLTLQVSIKGTSITNHWNIWVYPAQLQLATGDVTVTSDIEVARKVLAKGKKVLLNLPRENTQGLEGKFLPVFWSPVHFPNQPGTMGVLCNPRHAALSQFPTEEHSNWQWWDLCKNATTLQLDSIEKNIDVIVTMMDNFYKNRNLGLVFETQVGKGKLVVCSIDLKDVNQRPASRQLKYSLLEYMKSSKFCPTKSIDFNTLKSHIYNAEQKKLEKKSIYDD